MLSKKESQLGVTMARIAAIGTIIIFAIQAAYFCGGAICYWEAEFY